MQIGGVALGLVLLFLAIVSWLRSPTVVPVPVPAPTTAAVSPRPTPTPTPEAAEPEAAEPEAAEAPEPEAAVAAAAEAPAPNGAPIDKKAVRREMFDALKAKRYGDAADAGLRLRESVELDWEAHLALGDALRQANRGEEAAPVFQDFVDKFPTNAHLDVALFRLANLLAKSDKQKAAEAYKRVAADPKSKYKGDASKALAQLK